MLKLHPEILVKDGRKQFAVLPYEEFLAIQERLADADDLLELRKAKRAEVRKRSVPLTEVKRQLELRKRVESAASTRSTAPPSRSREP